MTDLARSAAVFHRAKTGLPTGKSLLQTLAFWTGEVIGALCLFIILFGGIIIGAALQ